MAVIAPWLQPIDFLGASEAGSRLGLSRQQMLQEAASRAAELSQRGNEAGAALALREAALKQQGLLGNERLQNQANALAQREGGLDAREALDKARADEIAKKNPFVNTGGGLMQQDENGKWHLVPGTTRPPTEKFDTVSQKFPAVQASPADVTPASTGWFGFGAHPAVTNAPAIPYQPERTVTHRIPLDESAAADALKTQQNSLPDFNDQGSGFIGSRGGVNGFDPTATGFTMKVPAANSLKPSSFIGTPGGQNQYDPTATGFTLGKPDMSKGIPVRNKKTGATGIQMPDGTIIPDATPATTDSTPQ